MAPRKVNFAQALRTQATALADAVEELESLYQIYFDSGYNSGGSDEITDGDIANHDLTVAQLAAVITLIENQSKLLDNQAPVTGDYRATLNAMRTITP